MPMARLAQYQHCLFRRNSIRTRWSSAEPSGTDLREQIQALRLQWHRSVDADDEA
ncbi:hypothetical protein N9Y81_02590 [Akkermansiaceae bacterium]|nr:hypothetical protein [Akkermansiaceae bacterium]